MKEVIETFNYIKEIHPEVTTFIVNKEGKWLFCDNDFNAPKFLWDIDISRIEETVDSIQELPFIYQRFFEIGDNVDVENSIDNHSFTGFIVDFKDDYYVVEDGDGDCFDIEENQLTLID